MGESTRSRSAASYAHTQQCKQTATKNRLKHDSFDPGRASGGVKKGAECSGASCNTKSGRWCVDIVVAEKSFKQGHASHSFATALFADARPIGWLAENRS